MDFNRPKTLNVWFLAFNCPIILIFKHMIEQTTGILYIKYLSNLKFSEILQYQVLMGIVAFYGLVQD